MKVCRKSILLIFAFILTLSCFKIYGQNNVLNKSLNSIVSTYTEKKTNGKSSWNLAEQRSKSGDAYQFMALRGDFGFINELCYSGNKIVISKGIALIDNIISSAYTSVLIKNNKTYRDNYKGWISLHKNNEYQREVPLSEGYSFFYITQFLYILKKNGWVDESKDNYRWWQSTMQFVEQNVWCKWLERSKISNGKDYELFLRSRVHMGSHWAGTAMYLEALTNNDDIKRQSKELQEQYNKLLKRNLKTVSNAYVWNSTYDDVEGTDAIGVKKAIIQDVSHGNHVVAYIVAAYELGNNSSWTKNDIEKLSSTFKNIIYDEQQNIFHDNVDGTKDSNRPGWGNFIADGWAKLARYDNDVKKILVKFGKTDKVTKYYQGLQYEASMYKSMR